MPVNRSLSLCSNWCCLDTKC